MPFFIIGAAVVGGILLLFTSNNEESKESKELPQKSDTPSGDQVNVEEIRRLRRELRHQLAIKKKNSSNTGNS